MIEKKEKKKGYLCCIQEIHWCAVMCEIQKMNYHCGGTAHHFHS